MANHLLHPDFVGAYVYQIIVNGTVRYIGKGRRYRATEHVRIAKDINRRRACGEKVKALPVHNKLAKALRDKAKVKYKIIWKALTDDAAYHMEAAEIASHPKEQLWNLHSGGSGGDAELMRQMWAQPEKRKLWVESISAGHKTQEYRQRARETAQDYWNDPEYYSRQVAREKALWADPEYRSKRIAILRRVWSNPELSAKKRVLVKSQWTPERKAAQAENRRKAWSDPEFKKRVMEKIASTREANGFRNKASETAKARWADPEIRERQVAAIRRAVKVRDDRP